MKYIDGQKQKITMDMARRIRYLRKTKGLSQEEVALRAELNPAYFGQVERGLKCPTVDTLFKIAQAMDISLSELVRTDDPQDDAAFLEAVQQTARCVPVEKRTQVLQVLKDVVKLFSTD